MAEDKRELILLRLKAIMDTVVQSADYSFRNKIEVPENRRPSTVVIDGDEVRDDKIDATGRGRPSNGPQYISMTPEIFILVEDSSKEVGTSLNLFRGKVLKAVMTDAPLTALCSEMKYEGFVSALAAGRTMEGQGRLHFTFVYLLRFDQL